jgi:hypothetical protein
VARHYLLLIDKANGMAEVAADGRLFVDDEQAIEVAKRGENYHRCPVRLYRTELVYETPLPDGGES